MSPAFWILIATVHCFICSISKFKKERMSQEDFEAGEFQADSLSNWRPFVTRLGRGRDSPPRISRLQAHFIFSVTLSLSGFLSVS